MDISQPLRQSKSMHLVVNKVPHILIQLHHGFGPTSLLEPAYDFYVLLNLHGVGLRLLHMLLSRVQIP